ncbi:MAG TPA: hypothetical protein VJB11_02025, partial [archaeon]|nr:hypothetical protein [archaeon]
MRTRKFNKKDYNQVVSLFKSMPDNFTKEGIDMLKDNLDLCIKKPKYYKAFVAIENKKVVGFISYGNTYRRG